MEDKELLAELQAGLKEQGVEVTEEEIQAAVDKLQVGELSEDNLEEVAGGAMGIGFSPWLPILPLLQLLVVCPKCHKAYVKRVGHRCKG